jgi:peroxiredoxin
VGGLAPEFTFTSQEGTPVSLKDYRGKWVALYFYLKAYQGLRSVLNLTKRLRRLAETTAK